jgi:multidrug transporter EmrE-like cation transporter
MALTVALVSLLAERLWVVLPRSPYFDSPASVGLTLGLVAGGAAIAFAMVWVEFTVIKLTSALTFMVAGTFKEIVTVLAAVAFLGESFSRVNAAGLAVLVAGVALFNYDKYRKVAAEQRAAALAAAERAALAAAESAAAASASSQNPPSAAASAYETFVPSSSSYPAVSTSGSEAAARKRRGGAGLGGDGDRGGASLDSGAPPLSSSASTPTTAEEEGTGATPPASAAAGGPGGSPLRPRAGSSLAPSGANGDRGGDRGEGG